MKPLFIFLGILLAGILGYKNEPSLRYQLTGIRPGKLTGKAQPGGATAQATIDPATLTAEQLPEKVMLITDVKVTDPAADLTMTIQAGNKVKLVRIEGTNAVVSPGAGPYTGTLPIANTDLMTQLEANPPTPATNPATDPTAVPAPAPAGDSADPSTVAQPVTTTDPAATPATDPMATPTTDPSATPPATDPAATPAADPFAVPTPTDPAATPPATDPSTTTTPAPAADPAAPATDPTATTTTPAPATDPAAVVTPTPAPVPAVPRATGAAGIVPIMQASIRGGQIKEFAFAQVLGWKAEPNETVDGQVFQAGTVTYKTETIFGVKTLQAKAYIKNGKVQRWIWLKSGVEIK